jgi:hypothetical protein
MKSGIFVNFGQFPCSWIRIRIPNTVQIGIRIQESQIEAEPGGSGSIIIKIGILTFSRAVLRIRDVYPGSRILIFTHPGSRIPDLGSRIPDPKTATKERGEKN